MKWYEYKAEVDDLHADAMNKETGSENVLAAEVTPGWWADKIITPGGNQGMIGKKPAFRGVLQLTYDDGTTQLLGTNTTDWLAGVAGPLKDSSLSIIPSNNNGIIGAIKVNCK